MRTKIVKNPRTDVDVELLRKVFPDLLPDGREVLHSQIESVLGSSRLTSRYKRVVTKWRRGLLLERSVWLDGMLADGRGFVALTADEMTRFGNRAVRATGRKLQRAIAVVMAADEHELSESARLWRGKLIMAMEKMTADQRAALRDISKALRPIKQLPRAGGE